MLVGYMAEPVKRLPGDTRPTTELYKEAVETAAWLEDIGVDFLTVGEHHFMETEWNSSPLMLLAAIARETSTLRLGTNVLLTPFYNPLRLAEDIATLDLISGGRAQLINLGTGSIDTEFETFGIDPKERHGRTFETLEFIRRCFEGPESFDFKGKYFQFPNVRITSQPVQKPFPLWYGGHGPKNSFRAGKLGYHFGGNNQSYLDGLAEGGHNLEDFFLLEHASAYVEATTEAVERLRKDAQENAQRSLDEYTVNPATRRGVAFENESAAVAQEVAPPVLVGTPEEILAELEPKFKDSNVTHLFGGGPPHWGFTWAREHRSSMELFYKEVAPVLRGWGRNPEPATN